MAEVFTMPDFLRGVDAETIQSRMMSNLPPDIDDMPGGFPYDFTMPTALEIDKFTNYQLALAIQCVFPAFAIGEWLDWHGAKVRVYRRKARYATGMLRIAGKIGLTIPKGTIFCTAATNDGPSIMYSTDVEVMIENGIADIPITGIEAGTGSNVMAGTICLAQKPIEGLTEITNLVAITDGADIEDDETYRDRILEVYRTELMYVGNPADYVRWAKEVSGVGAAICIPEWDGPGTVKLVITDTSGEPASRSILDEVHDHIVKSVDSLERLAPIGATLTVVAPEPIDVDFICVIKIDDTYAMDTIREAIRKNISGYFAVAIEESELKFARCFSIVDGIEGVIDVKTVTLNGKSENIRIDKTQYPRFKSLTITQYL